MSHQKIQIHLINWILLPLIASQFILLLGVKPVAFLLSGCTWGVLLFSQRFVTAFMAEEEPHETAEIDKEVARMEGRRVRISNNFEIEVPEDFKLRTIDEHTLVLVHIPTNQQHALSIELNDKHRILDTLEKLVREMAHE